MKTTKLLAMCMALAAMTGLSSCLSSNDSNTATYLKVSQSFGTTSFYDAGGTRIVPSNTLTTTPTSELVFARMKYDQSSVTSNMTSMTVSNFTYQDLTKVTYNGEQATDESAMTMSLVSGYGVWGKNEFFVLPVTYYYKPASSTDALKEELAKHKFYVYTNPETDLKSGVLTIHLRHVVEDLTTELGGKDAGQVYTQSGSNILYFRLSDILSDVQDGTITTIRIAYQTTSYSSPDVIAPDAEDQKETYASEVSLNTTD